MAIIDNTKLLVTSSVLAALGLYTLFKKTEQLPLIDAPELVASPAEDENDDRHRGRHEYDVVIIGGGTTGCVLAARLSEDPRVRVLLLEAGGSSRDLKPCQIPSAYPQIFHSHMDYDLFTEPQANAGGVEKYWPRAKLLGGCSTINAMVFHTCAPSDYDEWEKEQGEASGWAYKDFSKYFRKFEKYNPHLKYPDVDKSLRGTTGPVNVGFFGYLHSFSTMWIESCIKLGIPFKPDLNTSAGTNGVARVLSYIDSSGKRVTAENAYLTPEVLQRPNLKVVVHAHVTRILFQNHEGVKRASGVEFAKSKDGPRYRVHATQEVVLSAGAVHSPHILMLSGVGPKDHLAKHGIPVVHDLPGVGQNLQDHVMIGTSLRVKPGSSMAFLVEPKGLDILHSFTAVSKWFLFGTGVLSSNLVEAAAFARTDDPTLFPPDKYDIKDETSGPNAPDLEVIPVPMGAPQGSAAAKGDIVGFWAILLRPQSSGTIKLKSADPFTAPVIDPRYLSSQNDVATLVRGLRLLARIAQTDPLASLIVHDDDPALDHNLHRLTDAELELEVRKRAGTTFHPTTTCRMAKLEDGGVVDPRLRVHGIPNLRVADASIFTRIPSGHTSAPCLAVGEKAADLIKESLKVKFMN